MIYKRKKGVPEFECLEFEKRINDYVVLIPVINEGERIINELKKACKANIFCVADIAICDGGSTDGSMNIKLLKKYKVNTLLIKRSYGKQGTQLRMGIKWAIDRGYSGVITIDGNDKDSIEDVPRFVEKLKKGYDFIQGSRFISGGRAINTPIYRLLAVRLIHAPLISLTARHCFTDTTNAFRGYSIRYLKDNRVQPLREVFVTYELLAYLSVRASQLGFNVCEIPVKREYPKNQKTPTKISFLKGNSELLKILVFNLLGKYKP